MDSTDLISLPLSSEKKLPIETLISNAKLVEHVPVFLSNGTEIGKISEIFIFASDMIKGLLEHTTKETEKMIVLMPSYDQNKGLFFVEIIKRIYSGCLELTYEQLVMFVIISDEYVFDKKLVDYYLDDIYDNFYCVDKQKIFAELLKQTANTKLVSSLGTNTQTLFDKVKKTMFQGDDSFSNLPSAVFTFPRGRLVLMALWKSHKHNDETNFFVRILDKIALINQEKIKLSLKGLYDLFACIKWFDVDYNVCVAHEEDIKKMYPDFKIPKKMLTELNMRTILAKSYDKNNGKVFKFNPKMHKFNTDYPYTKYLEIGGCIDVYTTTINPELIKIYVSSNKQKYSDNKRMVLSTLNNNLCVAYLFSYRDDNQKIVTISGKWQFAEKLVFDISNANEESFVITFYKIFFVDPEKARKPIPQKPFKRTRKYGRRYDDF